MASLIDYIESLQKKPEPVRRRVLIAVVALIMIVIVTGWLRSLPSTLSTGVGASAGPFSVISDSAKDFKKILQPPTQ